MSIVKMIEIDGKQVAFRASAAIPRIYRMKFQRLEDAATPLFRYKEFLVEWGGSYGNEYRQHYLLMPYLAAINNLGSVVEKIADKTMKITYTLTEEVFERFFYETECIKSNWSVRELRRQIKTNLYIRAGISKKPELLMTQSTDNIKASALSIKDPFTFEFLGLEAKDAVSESDLEQALMDHLQEFMLELGECFCFEARQKRIIIDDKYYFIDLVFYPFFIISETPRLLDCCRGVLMTRKIVIDKYCCHVI